MDQFFQSFPVSARTIAAVLSGIHGKADHICLPILTKLPEAVLIHIIWKPGQTVGADSTQLYRMAVFVHKLCAIDTESAVYGRADRTGDFGFFL